PFYVEGVGFVPAGGLAIGNAILTRAGPPLMVAKIEWHRRPEGDTVYNLVVEDDHTYFVGQTNGGVWVHNPRCRLPNYKAQPGEDALAEDALRAQLEKEGVTLEEKGHVYAPGPDAEWNRRGEFPGWNWAEIKPNSRRMRKELFKQIRDRYDDGYT